jgi:hypothetical protein
LLQPEPGQTANQRRPSPHTLQTTLNRDVVLTGDQIQHPASGQPHGDVQVKKFKLPLFSLAAQPPQRLQQQLASSADRVQKH